MTLHRRLWELTALLTIIWLLHVYFDAPGRQCGATFLAAFFAFIAACVVNSNIVPGDSDE